MSEASESGPRKKKYVVDRRNGILICISCGERFQKPNEHICQRPRPSLPPAPKNSDISTTSRRCHRVTLRPSDGGRETPLEKLEREIGREMEDPLAALKGFEAVETSPTSTSNLIDPDNDFKRPLTPTGIPDQPPTKRKKTPSNAFQPSSKSAFHRSSNPKKIVQNPWIEIEYPEYVNKNLNLPPKPSRRPDNVTRPPATSIPNSPNEENNSVYIPINTAVELTAAVIARVEETSQRKWFREGQLNSEETRKRTYHLKHEESVCRNIATQTDPIAARRKKTRTIATQTKEECPLPDEE